MQQAGVGAHSGRHHTRQQRGLACARDTATGRHQGRTGRGIWVDALAPPSHSVRDIVEARAGQPVRLQSGDRLVPSAATVFAGGGRAAHHGDEAAEPRGHRVARPGISHGDPQTVDTVQSERTGSAWMVMGVNSQDGHNRARAQAKTAIEPPDEAVTTGCLRPGQAPQHAGGIDADDREASHPMHDGLRARCVLEAKSPREETQDARDGAPPDPRHDKAWQGQPDDVHLRQGDESLRWALELTETRLGRGEGGGGAGPLGGEASARLALVSIAVAALRGLVLPWSATGVACTALTHRVRSPAPMAAGSRGRLGLS